MSNHKSDVANNAKKNFLEAHANTNFSYSNDSNLNTSEIFKVDNNSPFFQNIEKSSSSFSCSYNNSSSNNESIEKAECKKNFYNTSLTHMCCKKNPLGSYKKQLDTCNCLTITSASITNTNKNNDESIMTNYTSIEKLAVLKPQSKDYILCFDTSSIDQNSSCTSNDAAFNFNISTTHENLLSDSDLIQNSSE